MDHLYVFFLRSFVIWGFSMACNIFEIIEGGGIEGGLVLMCRVYEAVTVVGQLWVLLLVKVQWSFECVNDAEHSTKITQNCF